MAPNNPEDSSVEPTQEREDFLNKLAEYHEKRGWVLLLVSMQ
jgi:chromatin structure-remodeling complex subunit RSC9